MNSFTKRVYSLLNSRRFFTFIIIFFLFEATWIAISAAYPQAFDENFHFGLIQIYSHHWLPFLNSQPSGGNSYGAVARDPSYLYHYLMSFPYRIISQFTHETIGQVIALRFINVGLFAASLLLFHKILIRAGVSRSLTNVSILLFALIPIVPQLAAQINYDNLLIPLVAWTILLTFDLIDQLRKHKPSAKTIITLISVCLFASLVKYAFLPIFLAVIVFLFIVYYRNYRHNFGKFVNEFISSWKSNKLAIKILLSIVLIIATGLFIQRDVVNIVKYHSIAPNCSTVLSVNDCKAYSPWYYNYQQHQYLESQEHIGKAHLGSPLFYSGEWIYWMWYRLFFAVNGPVSSFANYPPLPLPSAAAIVFVVFGLVLLIKNFKTVFKNNIYLILLFSVSLVYIAVLFLQGYATYHYTFVLENMNGRYLLPVTLLLVAVFARAISIGLRRFPAIKAVLVCIVLLLFLEGGGLFTFISRSDDTWDVQNSTVKKVNNAARKVTRPVLYNGQKYYFTSYWFFN